jgi:7-cyano-7-deazaguanine synthase in queuosine biosynthesis
MAESVHHLLCNGADAVIPVGAKTLRLDYRADKQRNVRIELPGFVHQLLHVPARLLDLLEIAAYVYCADRWSYRGAKTAVEYQAWSRDFVFHIKVRDFDFWSRTDVCEHLSAALTFLSGDRSFEFDFQRGHKTPAENLFDLHGVSHVDAKDARIALFSGGLDSLAGCYEILHSSNRKVCLVSHRSSQPQIGKTQDALVHALHVRFPNRVQHYRFECNLTGQRALEETQRTRMFLYSATATTIAGTVGTKEFTIFENGITSFNFLRRQELVNARATRTTHPQTIERLQTFFSTVIGDAFHIVTPFLWKTKPEVISDIATATGTPLIVSAVSCSRTFHKIGAATHCGECSQCIDRRFASYAANLDDIDDAVPYARNLITAAPLADEAKTTLVDYIRQAHEFATWNPDHLVSELFGQIAESVEYLGVTTEEEACNRIAELCQRYGKQIMKALACMRAKHDRVEHAIAEGSLLSLVAVREYLKAPVDRLIESVCSRLSAVLPVVFQRKRPENESDLNDKIAGVLKGEAVRFEREHPAVRFGLATAIPDHSASEHDLVIETKYVRSGTPPSRASEGMAADLVKYPNNTHILFIVYDPNRAINDDSAFREALESKRACTVHIIR